MSRARTVLEVHLKRRGMGPESADVKEVGEILLAIAEAVRGALGDVATAAEEGEPLLSLVRIEKGNSLDFAFATRHPREVRGAIEEVVGAYQSPEASSQPAWARESGRKLVDAAKALKCSVEVRTAGTARTATVAVLRRTTVFSEPPRLRGRTVLAGEVLRVGGKEPRVALDTGGPDGTVTCRANREITQALAHRLYERVAVEGTESRSFPSLELLEFSIERVLAWRPGGIDDGLLELRESLGKAWSDVPDVVGTLRRIKGGAED